MNPHRRWRRARLLALRGFRLLRRHYLTLISAAIIATLAVVSLRSDAFQSARRVPPAAAQVQDTLSAEDAALQYIQSIVWSPPTAELGLRSIVYYIYEDEPQRRAAEQGLGDLALARFKLDEGGPEDTNFFVRAATPQEEEEATEEIARAAELARAQGYRFQVIDLRTN